ncbi:CSGA-like protein [Mya arenaria]|uniref:CSGA-like protein n=1 Tax=Mya arenaria TaxID=6604 RepID=A0ABY7FGI6_MYAAR|nr:CSGA-like protein [Mya arenaria]
MAALVSGVFIAMSTTSIATVLVQGASRGIGLQFCRTLLSRQPNTCAAAEEVGKRHGRLDLLINCAGVLHPSGRGETRIDGDMQNKRLWPSSDGQTFWPATDQRNCHVWNTPARLQANTLRHYGKHICQSLGGWYSYRMSKAALNMATKNLSIELGRGRTPVICVALHPGTVDTDLSRPYHKNVKNLFTTEDSVKKLLTVIDSLTVDDTGKFFTYNKELLPF